MNTYQKSRRVFISSVSMLAASAMFGKPKLDWGNGGRKLKLMLVGTGVRGMGFWGTRLLREYGDILEFVSLCDVNPGRLAYAKKQMGIDCPVGADFEGLIDKTKPDLIIVATTDATHHEYIVRGLDAGIDVLTEKPLTIDEDKCQQILDAERRSKKNLIVGFNYRWSPYMTKIKEMLQSGSIGKVTSVDFNWYLNTYHGASYFRRWHGLREMGGTLWVHKSTHHFDLLNWWLDSEPQEVFAYGALEHYGTNGPFRGVNCRTCPHTADCDFYWDIRENKHLMNLYVNNESYDGYIRDKCLFRPEINIYDKMSAQIKYADGVVANYSLTTYSPYEGWRIAFNGTKGRIEAWQDIPYFADTAVDQGKLHKAEMAQDGEEDLVSNTIIQHRLWEEHDSVVVTMERKGHGGGDKRMHAQIFEHPEKQDPFGRAAGVRDGAMSVLVGIAARKSIEKNEPIKIASLTSLQPRKKRLS